MEVFVRRKLTAIAASSAVILAGGVVVSSPANAVNRSVAVQCNLNALSFSPSSVSADAGDTVTFSIGGPWAFTVTAVGATGPASISGSDSQPKVYTMTGNSGGSLTLTYSSGSCSSAPATLTVNGSAPAPSGDTSSTPVLDTLSLAVEASGASCTGGNPTGYSGSWLTLPSADQCTQSGPTAKPGARLLGWATSSSFPIARAQAQIDKKWGVIDEEINGVRMIFIPAGMATFVSGSNNLFPIWSA